MSKIFLRVAAFIVGFTIVGLVHAVQPLLAPSELVALKGKNLRMIDIRDPKLYAEQHIPHSLSAPYGTWRGPSSNPGQIPDIAALTTLVQHLGLNTDSHAVVVSTGADTTDFGAAARVYWTLKVLGFKNLSILNGGVKAWADANLPLDNKTVTIAASQIKPSLNQSMIASRDDVVAKLGKKGTLLVDARPAAFFNGDNKHPAAKLAGTLQGAVNLENEVWFNPGATTFVSTDKAKQIAKQGQFSTTEADETISFCNTGHWAATNWFALSEIVGKKNVKLYAGSMVDWTQASTALPMDNVPNRAKQLLNDLKK
jgi:thiosulfate/3-mercaptopyruvate sulfurtransferase